jgi:hypothetical protein
MAKARTEPGQIYQHRYPKECPHCSADLLTHHSLLVLFSIDGTEVARNSQLDENGILMDVDRLIANGYHSDTICDKCAESISAEEILE